MCLGAIWAVRGSQPAVHARAAASPRTLVIAVLLFGLGAAARFRNLPWELISLGFAVAALVVAARKPLDRVHNVLAGLRRAVRRYSHPDVARRFG